MLLIPLVAAAVLAYAIYAVRRRHSITSVAHAGPVEVGHVVTPATELGWIGVGAFVLTLLTYALVNVVQVPFLRWALIGASVLCAGLARFIRRDESTVVLAVFVISALAAVAGVLFLLGEVLIGHD